MARPKNDGRGRLGGRAPGTPNKEKPLKTFLRAQSADYFTPNQEEIGDDGKPTGRIVSKFDLDLAKLDPATRVDAELKLLRFHTPQMQATSIDMNVADEAVTIVERLRLLANGQELPPLPEH